MLTIPPHPCDKMTQEGAVVYNNEGGDQIFDLFMYTSVDGEPRLAKTLSHGPLSFVTFNNGPFLAYAAKIVIVSIEVEPSKEVLHTSCLFSFAQGLKK